MNGLIYKLLFSAVSLSFASLAAAETIQCNKRQTQCQTESNEWTIGDRVGVFNKYGELVAVGKVQNMQEERRTVKISKRHGKIRRSHRFALLNTQMDDSYKGSYKVYNRPAPMSVGASAGMTSLSIGEGAPGLDVELFGQWRKWRGIQLVGRGTYVGASGEISRTRKEIETEEININGFGALGGAAYTLRENQQVSFRGELGLGFMYMVADIAGDSALIEDSGFDSNLYDGFGKYVRSSGSMLLNYGQWHVNLEVAYGVIHNARATTFAGGIIKDLK